MLNPFLGWPTWLRLTGATQYPEFNRDYALEMKHGRQLLWRATSGHVACSERNKLEFRRDLASWPFISVTVSQPTPQTLLESLSNWEEWDGHHMQKSSTMGLERLLGRFDQPCDARGRPAQRPDHGKYPMQAGVRDMNYTQRRCPGWTQAAAVGELVQNWKDEVDAAAERSGGKSHDVRISRTVEDLGDCSVTKYEAYMPRQAILLGTLEVHKFQSKPVVDMNFTNFSDQMHIEMLFDGFSGQDKLDGQRRGKFGDGLQSAICVLCREDVDIKIYSNGHLWSFGWTSTSDLQREQGVKLLQVTTARSRLRVLPNKGVLNCVDDTCVKVRGLQTSAFDERQFLFLCAPTPTLSNRFGDILLGDEYRGSVYVRDMRVLNGDGRNRYGLNLHRIESKARDRMGHLEEGEKLSSTFNVWHDHFQIGRGNERAAELLYDALRDENSLEALAFTHKQLMRHVGAECARMLMDVFLVKNPGAFAISETDYKGFKVVTGRMKKKHVNLNQKLITILKQSPSFMTPEQYWEQQQKRLAESATRVEGTVKEKLMIRIVLDAIGASRRYCVTYDTAPGQDIRLKLKAHPRAAAWVVHEIEPEGPASEQQLPAGAELCDPVATRVPLHIRQRNIVVLADLQPFMTRRSMTFNFELKLKLDRHSVELVSAQELKVPVVVLAEAETPLALARFVVNRAMCASHGTGSHECPTVDQGLCFCGVHELYDAIIFELERILKIKFSHKDKRWMEEQKRKLLEKHKSHFRLQGSQAASSSRDAVLVDDAPNTSMAFLLEAYVRNDLSMLTPQQRKTVELAEEIAGEMEHRRRLKTESTEPQNAWLGDRLNDSYLAVLGHLHGLSPYQLDRVRQEVLSAQGLSGGRGRRVAEELEAQVGRQAQAVLPDLEELLQEPLSRVRLPDSGTLRERIEWAVRGIRRRERSDSRWESREPVRLRPQKARRTVYRA